MHVFDSGYRGRHSIALKLMQMFDTGPQHHLKTALSFLFQENYNNSLKNHFRLTIQGCGCITIPRECAGCCHAKQNALDNFKFGFSTVQSML